jgi:hypothetical protein
VLPHQVQDLFSEPRAELNAHRIFVAGVNFSFATIPQARSCCIYWPYEQSWPYLLDATQSSRPNFRRISSEAPDGRTFAARSVGRKLSRRISNGREDSDSVRATS